MNTWNSEDLDMILLNGNDRNLLIHGHNDYLLVNEIPGCVKFNGKEYKINQSQTLCGTLCNTFSELSVSLEEASQIFHNYEYMDIWNYVSWTWS